MSLPVNKVFRNLISLLMRLIIPSRLANSSAVAPCFIILVYSALFIANISTNDAAGKTFKSFMMVGFDA
jgi:hypothetical protein